MRGVGIVAALGGAFVVTAVSIWGPGGLDSLVYWKQPGPPQLFPAKAEPTKTPSAVQGVLPGEVGAVRGMAPNAAADEAEVGLDERALAENLESAFENPVSPEEANAMANEAVTDEVEETAVTEGPPASPEGDEIASSSRAERVPSAPRIEQVEVMARETSDEEGGPSRAEFNRLRSELDDTRRELEQVQADLDAALLREETARAEADAAWAELERIGPWGGLPASEAPSGSTYGGGARTGGAMTGGAATGGAYAGGATTGGATTGGAYSGGATSGGSRMGQGMFAGGEFR